MGKLTLPRTLPNVKTVYVTVLYANLRINLKCWKREIYLMLKKNDICQIKITDMGSKAEGIGRFDNFVIFADNCLPGDICEVKILKVNKSRAYGKVLTVIRPSPFRVLPPCQVSDKCGGCALMHMDYAEQLKLKEKKVHDSLTRIGGFKTPNILPIEPMYNPKAYRNKSSIPVREEKGGIKIGYYAKNSHRIVENQSCCIADDIVEEVIESVYDYMASCGVRAYNELNKTGVIRHIVVKSAFGTGQVMVILVLNTKNGKLPKSYDYLVQKLIQIKGMTSICFNYNKVATNVIMGKSNFFVWGKEYISDRLGEFDIKISPHSFYQINPVQALKMYECALGFAEIGAKDTVIDAYCGIGTISLFFAGRAKKVYGIETVAEAISDANENAKINEAKNLEFILGKAEEVIYNFIDKEISVDIIVVDPPRKGCDMKFLEAVGKLRLRKVVYISCNPDTLARDAAILAGFGYELKAAKPFDMFCHTLHVEIVALFELGI